MVFLNRLYIIALQVFNSAKLFQKINDLDWYQNTLRQWVSSLSLKNESNVLEVGCTTGALSHHLSHKINHVTGIDYSSAMIKMATQHQSTAHFQVADATQLPFADSIFDAVFSASLINIIDQPETMIAEMVRVCKPNGSVSILVPLERFANNDLKQLRTELKLKGFSAAALTAWHRSPPKMNPQAIIKLFENAGLHSMTQSLYLNNMLISVNAIKN